MFNFRLLKSHLCEDARKNECFKWMFFYPGYQRPNVFINKWITHRNCRVMPSEPVRFPQRVRSRFYSSNGGETNFSGKLLLNFQINEILFCSE